MTLYYVILVLLFIMRAIIGNRKINHTYIFGIISFLLFAIIYIVRDLSVGWDTITYHRIFLSAPREQVFKSYLEPGWILLIKGIYAISATDQFYFFVIAMIGMIPFFKVSNKISLDISESIIIYYLLGNYFNLMNQQRSQIAVGICMISFYYLLKKKYIISVIWVIIAFTIHESALVFLIFILFDFVINKYSKKIFYIIVSAVLIIMLFYDQLFGFATKYFYTSYTTEAQLIKEASGGNLKDFTALTVLSLIILYVDRINHKRRVFEDYEIEQCSDAIDLSRLRKLLITAVLFCLSLQFISIRSTMIARFSDYFSIYFSILIPLVFSQCENKRVKKQYRALIFLILIIYMTFYLRFSEGGLGRDGVIPYLIYQR